MLLQLKIDEWRTKSLIFPTERAHTFGCRFDFWNSDRTWFPPHLSYVSCTKRRYLILSLSETKKSPQCPRLDATSVKMPATVIHWQSITSFMASCEAALGAIHFLRISWMVSDIILTRHVLTAAGIQVRTKVALLTRLIVGFIPLPRIRIPLVSQAYMV
jgi:hypothetical protein